MVLSWPSHIHLVVVIKCLKDNGVVFNPKQQNITSDMDSFICLEWCTQVLEMMERLYVKRGNLRNLFFYGIK